MLVGPATVTASPLLILKVAEQKAVFPQPSKTLKLTVTLPPAHKSGAVNPVNPEGTKAPFPPVAVNPVNQVANAASNSA